MNVMVGWLDYAKAVQYTEKRGSGNSPQINTLVFSLVIKNRKKKTFILIQFTLTDIELMLYLMLLVKALCYKLEGCGFETRRGE
jgi:hypothetical protein